MSVSGHRLIVDRLHEAFNARRFDEYAELLDQDVVMVVDGRPIRGRAAVCDYAAAVAREIPGARSEVDRVVAESGEEIVTRTRFVDASSASSEPSTWGAWRLPLAMHEVYRVAGGRVAERHSYIDAVPAKDEFGGDLVARAGVVRLMNEQAALRRVATLVARGAVQSEVFEAIVSEAAELFGEETWLVRYGTNDSATIVAQHGGSGLPELAGSSLPRGGVLEGASRLGQPIRVDSYAGLSGTGPELARRLGVVASAAAPLLVQGTPWGALGLVSRGPPLAAGIEDRLAQFADLAVTAIATAQSRAELQSLADEQAALRRVAELVARGAPTQQVFDLVTVEAGRLLDDAPTILFRYERSGSEVVVVARGWITELGRHETYYTVGASLPVPGGSGRARVWRTGRAERIDSYAEVADTGVVALGFAGSVSAPITVDGRLWGVLTAGSPGPPLPTGTEERLARFCELVAVAIANAESRAELSASRARIVASADEARRRLARDVHDGAQQRLVHTLITLKQAKAALKNSDAVAAALLEESLAQAEAANGQLRELANGILPAALARGGLRAGVESLVRHAPLRVDADVLGERLPVPVETTGYFVIAEALTNVMKHAGASRACVRARAAAGQLEVEVSDDGGGGADPANGSGLTGIGDRVDAAGGSMSVSSPPGAGTRLSVTLPIEPSEMRARP